MPNPQRFKRFSLEVALFFFFFLFFSVVFLCLCLFLNCFSLLFLLFFSFFSFSYCFPFPSLSLYLYFFLFLFLFLCIFRFLLLGGAVWSLPSSGGVAFLISFYVEPLGFFPLWVVSPVWWCCLPSPPLGSGAFPLSSVGWCCLVLLLPFGWCCCSSFSF